jgi:hypothetical protein
VAVLFWPGSRLVSCVLFFFCLASLISVIKIINHVMCIIHLRAGGLRLV